MRTLLVSLDAHYRHVNLAVRSLQKAARDSDVDILDLHVNLPFRRALSDIALRQPDVVLFSCYIWNIDCALRLCRALKRALPSVIIALGGPEVTYDAEALLLSNPSVDFVLSGEGEASFPAFMRALKGMGELLRVPGLCGREARRVYENPPPPLLAPDQWPDVYEDGIDGLHERILYVETSRGCPYRCAYCLSSGEPVRALEAGEAVRRLTYLAERGAKIIKLVDRTFNCDRARAEAIWRGLIEHSERTGAKPTYHFEIGAHLIDERAAEILRSAPFALFQIEAGIQSTDRAVLHAIGRDIPFERVREGLDRLRGICGLHVHADLIAGLPEQDMKSLARSFDDAYALGADMLQLGFLKLLRGSALRERADALGIVYEDDAPYEVIATPWLSFAELCHLKDIEIALEWYGNSGRYRGTMRRFIGDRSPFDEYSRLASQLRANGTFNAARAERARADALWQCARRTGDDVFAELLRHDLCAAGLRHELPAELRFGEDGELRALLRQSRPGARRIVARRYPLDVALYAERGEMAERETNLIYPPEGGYEYL